MINKIDIQEFKLLKETTITIDCGLLNKFNRNEFVKKLIDLVEEFEDYFANKDEEK